jgi:uncharacterized membrane protein
MKAFLVACEVATWALLARLIGRRGLPRERLLVAAWSPLALVEVSGSGHNEPLGILLLLVGLLALEAGRPAASALAVGAAFLSKLVPGLLALPWARRFRPAHGLAAVALVAGATLPYASAGRGLARTLGDYSEHWRFNETLFALLPAASGPSIALLALFALGATLAWRGVEPARACLLMAAAWLLLMPSVLPWYALWLVPLLCLVEAAGALAFTATVALAYLAYPGWLAGGPWQLGWGIRAVEYGLPLAIQVGRRLRSHGMGLAA